MAELVDAPDSKSGELITREGSIPSPGTNLEIPLLPMKFCSACGNPVSLRTPEGDHLARHVCDACGAVHYQNPKLIVGCVPEHDGRILLCRRAIEPRLGFWTIPAGFMENGETTQDGARRESFEEAQAEVEIGSLLAVVHVLHADQVHVMFRAQLPAAALRPEPGEPGGGPVRRGRDSVAGHRLPQRRFRAAPLLRRPSARRRRPPLHRARLPQERRVLGRIRFAAAAALWQNTPPASPRRRALSPFRHQPTSGVPR